MRECGVGTEEVVGRELVVVPHLDHQHRRKVQLRLIQTPEVLLQHKGVTWGDFRATWGRFVGELG